MEIEIKGKEFHKESGVTHGRPSQSHSASPANFHRFVASIDRVKSVVN